MRLMHWRADTQSSERLDEVFSCLDIGYRDFFGKQFVGCRQFRSHHEQMQMDLVLFISPHAFLKRTCVKFDFARVIACTVSLSFYSVSCWRRTRRKQRQGCSDGLQLCHDWLPLLHWLQVRIYTSVTLCKQCVSFRSITCKRFIRMSKWKILHFMILWKYCRNTFFGCRAWSTRSFQSRDLIEPSSPP